MRLYALLTAVIAVTGGLDLRAAKYELPERILSGYGGWFLGAKQDSLRWIMDRMQNAAFNSVEIKIQNANTRVFPLEDHLEEARSLMQYAVDRGLLFQLYLYPVPHRGDRVPEWDEHRELPCAVDELGARLEKVFLLTDARCWKQLFFHAFKFLKHHDCLPFATLKFDLETIPAAYSYDDANWARFAAAHPGLDLATSASGRLAVLKAAGLAEAYKQSFREETGKAIRAFVAALREVDPDVILGYMPAEKGPFHYIEMEKALAVDGIPAVIDNWLMYNGGGYLDSIAEAAVRTRQLAAGNVSVPWIRPNSYAPEAIAPAVYQAACHAGGYSLWSLDMLCKGGNPRQGHSLLAGTTVDDYYAAFKKANLAVRADMREGTLASATRIAREKTKSLAAPLDWSDVEIPALRPVGDGSGDDQFICTRERQTFFIWAEGGAAIKMAIRHDAASQRPIALHYILLTDRKERIREEVVNPGDTEKWSVVAPKTGVYALVISGGEGGQAWYSVKVGGGLHYALDARARRGTVIFRAQTVCLPGADQGNPTVHFSSGGSTAVITPAGEPSRTMKTPKNTLDLAWDTTKCCSFARHPEIGYLDAVDVSFPGGTCPFVWGSAGRGLVPVDARNRR